MALTEPRAAATELGSRLPAALRQASPRFERTMTALNTLLLVGGYTDAWAHRHVPKLETFFTPWHAILYTAMFGNLAFLAINALRAQRSGLPLKTALPTGYGLSLVGCILFAIGGVLDLIWHLIFGIELSISALLSPTHILLMFAVVLIVTGPLRSGWWSSSREAGYPVIISATLLLSMFTFFSQFDQPIINLWPAPNPVTDVLSPERVEELGILGIMLQTAAIAGIVLYLLRRFSLPRGSITILVGFNGLLLSLLQGNFDMFAVALVGGILTDLLMVRLKRVNLQTERLRLIAFLAPVVVSGLYFLDLFATRGITWPVHLWAGTTVVCGMVGLLLSYLAFPPTRRLPV